MQKTITVLEVIHNLAQQKLFSLAHRNLKMCFRSAFFVHVKHRLWELLIREFYGLYVLIYDKRKKGSFLTVRNLCHGVACEGDIFL